MIERRTYEVIDFRNRKAAGKARGQVIAYEFAWRYGKAVLTGRYTFRSMADAQAFIETEEKKNGAHVH